MRRHSLDRLDASMVEQKAIVVLHGAILEDFP